MYSRVSQHLSINYILATEQYGFRKDRSTEHAAYTLTNGILKLGLINYKLLEFFVTSLRLRTV
jgi:hypothetical protein